MLASGTLKDLAAEYGISYPTVRLRLDRLIDKVRVIESQVAGGRFETALRSLYAEGRMDDEAFRLLLDAYREEETTRANRTA